MRKRRTTIRLVAIAALVVISTGAETEAHKPTRLVSASMETPSPWPDEECEGCTATEALTNTNAPPAGITIAVIANSTKVDNGTCSGIHPDCTAAKKCKWSKLIRVTNNSLGTWIDVNWPGGSTGFGPGDSGDTGPAGLWVDCGKSAKLEVHWFPPIPFLIAREWRFTCTSCPEGG